MNKQELKQRLKQIGDKGFNVTKLIRYTNLSYLCADMSHSFMMQAEKDFKGICKFKHEEKQAIKTCSRLLGKLSKEVDKTFNNATTSEGFGDLAEYLMEVAYLASQVKDEDQLKLISQIKLLIK